MKKQLQHILLGIIVCICFNQQGSAQSEANYSNNWVFGTKGGVTFGSGTGTVFTSTAVFGGLNEGVASVSDLNGNLLFYVGKGNIYTSTGTILTSVLKGGTNSNTQGYLILPKPCSATNYYVFVNGGDINTPSGFVGISYTEVDVSTTPYTIVSKDNILVATNTQICEKMAAAPHSNGVDYWVATYISNNGGTPTMIATQITSTGPGTQKSTSLGLSSPKSMGAIKFSKCGTKMAVGETASGGAVRLQTMNFNPADGSFSGAKTLSWPSVAEGPYGVEFSPSGNYLYAAASHTGNVYRYDLTLAIPVQVLLGNTGGGWAGTAQLGIDGNVYIAAKGQNYITKISNTDATTATFTQQGITLAAGGLVGFDLPNAIPAHCCPTLIPAPLANQSINTCPGNATFASGITGLVCPTYTWKVSTDGINYTTIADGGVYTGATTPSLTLTGVTASYNNYNYRIIVKNGNCKDSSTATLTVSCGCPPVTGTPTISGTATICPGGNTTLAGNVPAGNTGYYYQWYNVTTNTSLSTGTITNNAAHTITSPSITTAGTYRFRLVNAVGNINDINCYKEATQLVTVNPKPILTLAKDVILCPAGSINTGFKVKVSNISGAINVNYNWQVKASGAPSFTNITNGANYTGATTDTLTVLNPTLAMNNSQYQLVIKSATASDCVDTLSNIATLKFNTYVAFNATTYSSLEAAVTNKPLLLIKGVVTVPSTITYTITTAATVGTDYTLTSMTVNIPAGNYDGTPATGIVLPLNIVDDAIPELTETIKFDLVSSTGDVLISNGTCNLGVTSTTYFIVDDDCAKPALGPDKLYCEGATINQTLTGPAPAEYYTWSTGATTQSITVTTPGTYILNSGRFGSNLIANGDFSAGNNGFNTGYLYTPGIEFPGGGGRYNIVTNGVLNTWADQFTDHTTGTGNYMFIDGNGVAGVKVWSQNITVTPNTDYVFSAWVRNLSSAGNVNPILNFDVSGTNIGGVYTVLADPEPNARKWNQFYATWNSGSNTNITIAIEDNVVTASYNDFAIDDIYFSALSCSKSDTIVITQPLNPVVTVPANISICANGTTTATNFTSVATGTVTYAWTNDNTAIGLGASGTGDIPAFTATNATSSPITATISVIPTTNDCPGVAKTYTITVNPKPTAAITTSGTALEYCKNAQNGVTLTATDAGANTTYEWFKVTTSQSTAGANLTYNNATAGAWTVKVVNTATTCADTSASVTVIEKTVPVPTITNTASQADYCKGDNGITINAQPVAGGAYEWFNGTTSSGSVIPKLNALEGDWTLKITLNGCADTSVVFKVTEKPLPVAVIMPSATAYCIGDVNGVTLTATDAGAGATYEWFKNTVSQGAASATAMVTTKALKGDWTLKVILNGCNQTSAITTIIETDLPVATITTTGTALEYCANVNGVTLTALDQGVGATYEWFKDGIAVATTNTNTISNALEGSWTMKVTHGCSATTPTVTPVIEKPIPAATFTNSATAYCKNAGGVTLTAGAVTGATYEWFDGVTSMGTASANNVLNAALAGDYTVKVTLNGCTATSANTIITENALPTATISGSLAICKKVGVTGALAITLTGKGPWNLVYQKPDGTTVTANGTISSPLTVNQSDSGSYKVLSVKDANCTGTFSGTGTITYKTAPTISNAVRTCPVIGNPNFKVTFDITGGDASSYVVTGATGTLVGTTWTSDPISELVTASITVNDGGNCNPETQTFNKTCSCPTDGNMTGGGTICNDGVTTSTINVALEGTSPWEIEYTVDNGTATVISGINASPYSFTTSTKGLYKLTKTTDATCKGSSNGTATIDYYAFPTASISGANIVCVGNESANLTVNLSGKAPWDFTVVDPAGNKSLISISANPYTYVADSVGTYTISAIKDANCTGRPADISGSATLTAYVKPDTSNIKINCTNGDKYVITMDVVNGDGTTLAMTGSQGSWTGRSWTSQPIQSDVVTNLSLTDAKNCFPVAMNLTKNCPCPTKAAMSGDTTFCNNGTKTTVKIDLLGTSPWNVTYKLGNVATTVTSAVTPLLISNINQSGDYALVTVSDVYCTGTTSGSAKIIVNELPTSVVNGGGIVCEGSPIPGVKFTFTGTAPFSFNYTDSTNSLSGIANTTVYTVPSPVIGSYFVTGVTDGNGCVATSLKGTTHVTVNLLSKATLTGDNDICRGGNTPINVTFNKSGNAPFKITYDGGSGYEIISNITINPYQFTVKPTQTTAVKLIALADNNNCSNTNLPDIVNVKITQYPVVNTINNNAIMCSGSTTDINLVSTAVGTENSTYFKWTARFSNNITGVITPDTGNAIKQTITNLGNNLESVVYTVTPSTYTTTNFACEGSPKNVSVMVRKTYKPELGDDRLKLCRGTVVPLSAGNYTNGTFNWTVNNATLSTTKDTVSIVAEKDDLHVKVEYVDICSNTFTDTVLITTRENVSIFYSIGDSCLDFNTELVPQQLTFNETIDNWKYTFYNIGEVYERTAANPTLAYGFHSEGKYKVSLAAYNNGCKIGDTLREITIKNCYPKFVNVFTPNGDGQNDVWLIKDIENFPEAEVVIFNRWGVKVKEFARGYIMPWDGTNSEGQALEQGTYYYVVTLNRIKGDKGIFRGYVSIIKEK